jgi:acyl-CoA synthetase (AMP-forming)/AMP-acid ligase II
MHFTTHAGPVAGLKTPPSLLGIVREHAQHQPDAVAILETNTDPTDAHRNNPMLVKTYEQLWHDIQQYRLQVRTSLPQTNAGQPPVMALLVPNSYSFVVALLGGVWANNAIAVPMSKSQPHEVAS